MEQSFFLSLQSIFEGTPETDRMLWDVAMPFAGSKLKELMDRGEFVEMLKDHGKIAVAFMKAHFALPSNPPIPKPSILTIIKPATSTITNAPAPLIIYRDRPARPDCPGCHDSDDVAVGGTRDWWCHSCRTAFDD